MVHPCCLQVTHVTMSSCFTSEGTSLTTCIWTLALDIPAARSASMTTGWSIIAALVNSRHTEVNIKEAPSRGVLDLKSSAYTVPAGKGGSFVSRYGQRPYNGLKNSPVQPLLRGYEGLMEWHPSKKGECRQSCTAGVGSVLCECCMRN